MASKWQKPLLSLMRLRHMKNLSEYFRTTVCLQNRRYTHNGFSSIFALSSGHGKCGVSVIRVSGPHSSTTLCQMGRFEQHPEPRKAYVRKIYHSVSEEVLDKALVLWFPGKNELIHFVMTVSAHYNLMFTSHWEVRIVRLFWGFFFCRISFFPIQSKYI